MKKQSATSPFWKPKKGQSFSGVFSHWEAGSRTNPNPVMVFKDGHKVGLSYDIADKLRPVYKSLKSGKSKLSFTLTGTAPASKKGYSPVKKYSVTLDGKELFGSMSFERLDTKGIGSYFEQKKKG